MITRGEIADALTAAGMAGTTTQPGPSWPGMRGPCGGDHVGQRHPGRGPPGAVVREVALPNGATDVTVAEADPLVEIVGDALWLAGLRVPAVRTDPMAGGTGPGTPSRVCVTP